MLGVFILHRGKFRCWAFLLHIMRNSYLGLYLNTGDEFIIHREQILQWSLILYNGRFALLLGDWEILGWALFTAILGVLFTTDLGHFCNCLLGVLPMHWEFFLNLRVRCLMIVCD